MGLRGKEREDVKFFVERQKIETEIKHELSRHGEVRERERERERERDKEIYKRFKAMMK